MLAASCGPPPVLTEFDRAEIEVGGNRLSVAVADTLGLRNQGLRGVDALPETLDGMLFVFEPARSATFGMRDTLMPLDIWWFDADGDLIGSAQMEPCPAEPCTSYRSPAEVRWALETPLDEVDLEPGDRLMVIDSS